MPKREDLKKILIIGSGPIIISQACEFDYSGTQACKALREEGYEVVLVNSNPATIMTDPEMADRTYIEPITPEVVSKIIEKERPDALLPTLGGQTGLNTAVKVAEMGTLEKYGVEMIGAKYEAIQKAEDRELFRDAMASIGLDLPRSGLAHSMDEARAVAEDLGFPLIIRPSFTLGGTGGGIAFNSEEFEQICAGGLDASMIDEILIEESVIGWKEYELEVMRDLADNVVIICSIENFDAMGIHTGDSITVAPAQTLTDREYQLMRDAAIAIIREIGVETGGSNIQFAINPANGRMVIIEMNPRVSRSSALASKATGFPIAKIAAKLAVGYTLDEIPNDITRETPASFEPTIDYCVVKIPRFTFEKFPKADASLGISMKSVGEVMSIGRTFKEALQKGIRSLEIGRFGLGSDRKEWQALAAIKTPEEREEALEVVREKLTTPNAERLYFFRYGLKLGMSVREMHEISHVDSWFLENIREIVEMEEYLSRKSLEDLDSEDFFRAKSFGFSDVQLGNLLGSDEGSIRETRAAIGLNPVYKLVDTCAAEFEAYTPYYYSSYEREEEPLAHVEGDKPKVMILGGGPNRIGQGIEFDYCCVHASFALEEEGYESVMVNNNPETVSTDYDTSDRLYFEPLTLEDVMAIVEREKPEGIIVQFGGQTPLNLAVPLMREGAPIIGTSPDSIDRAEDRDRFKALLDKLGLRQPNNGTARSYQEAVNVAHQIGYPVVVRPSYVLGGRGMEIVYDDTALEEFMRGAVEVSPDHPVLIDKFLEEAVEIDVDAIADGTDVVVAGVMEHIEEAGVHSGDSACATPPFSLGEGMVDEIKEATYALARELRVIGLMNIQYAVKDEKLFVLEVNPRASRTVPYVSKATGISWAKVATKVMLGRTLKDLGVTGEVEIKHIAVKEAVLPFNRFLGVDTVLGPEMRSTGEVMGIDNDLGMAYAKSQMAAGSGLPRTGNIFVSVKDSDKRDIVHISRRLAELGFDILATKGTAEVLTRNGIDVRVLNKMHEGRPHVVDCMKNREIQLIINTPSGKRPRTDQLSIRSYAVLYNIPVITTMSAAHAALHGIESILERGMEVKPLQDWHNQI
ncbi:MAG: carbamoyl phosphate synthase large subunit [Candidatus Solincola sediminis]|uniref:Carbamoyl phosphate synthase large chain n=1 Tax=Candidatus Solincola sediminis TaxID=1797199 RepID=A0A1F2WIQ0_9ACTN|nr:MAG: carbamoyl phosphate synthase large subunit [Candidatus Solincola sediminis]OFW59759.1 MAG: carbamoyl phosphate synthase large subunit [Candidatus Solincola sediminis]